MLIEQIKLDGIHEGNLLVLDRNVRIVDNNGVELARYPERLTKPNSDLFHIDDISPSQFCLSLKKPPEFQRGLGPVDEVNRLMNDPTLSEIKKYSVRSGFPSNPHW